MGHIRRKRLLLHKGRSILTPTIPKNMRAAAINRFGGVETIAPQSLPVPDVGPDEVLICVEAAGVAVWDVLEREGGFAEMFGIEPRFPYVLGKRSRAAIPQQCIIWIGTRSY